MCDFEKNYRATNHIPRKGRKLRGDITNNPTSLAHFSFSMKKQNHTAIGRDGNVCYLIVVMVLGVCTEDNTHQITLFKYTQFIAYQLYPQESGKKKNPNPNNTFFFSFLSFCLLRATLAAYGGSQARGLIRAVAAGLHQSHSNARPEPRLRPTSRNARSLTH